ncbi:hypothetical protein Tco_0322853 [Tanacetum coccineum]
MENLSLCVQDASCITQEFALSGARLATRWVIRPGTAEAKDQPWEATCYHNCKHYSWPEERKWHTKEESVRFMDREVKKTKGRICIPIVKVRMEL